MEGRETGGVKDCGQSQQSEKEKPVVIVLMWIGGAGAGNEEDGGGKDGGGGGSRSGGGEQGGHSRGWSERVCRSLLKISGELREGGCHALGGGGGGCEGVRRVQFGNRALIEP